MYTNVKIWSLSYASVSDDDDLYVETVGLYDSLDKAVNAMKDFVANEIRESGNYYSWDIHDLHADYSEVDAPHTRKALVIEAF